MKRKIIINYLTLFIPLITAEIPDWDIFGKLKGKTFGFDFKTIKRIELAKQNVKSTIVFWPEFLRHLKCLIGSNDEIEQIIYRVKNTPILFMAATPKFQAP